MADVTEVPITGDRILTEEEKADIDLHRQALLAMGFRVKYILTSKNGFTKYVADPVPGTDTAKARLSLEINGFDHTTHRDNGRVDGWQITKRTQPGTGWE